MESIEIKEDPSFVEIQDVDYEDDLSVKDSNGKDFYSSDLNNLKEGNYTFTVSYIGRYERTYDGINYHLHERSSNTINFNVTK